MLNYFRRFRLFLALFVIVAGGVLSASPGTAYGRVSCEMGGIPNCNPDFEHLYHGECEAPDCYTMLETCCELQM